MAAAHDPGGLRPHPPGLRPGPRPSSEMARQVRTGAAAGGHLLAGQVRGATEPPPRSRAPPASQAMTLRVTLAPPGEPAAQAGGARRGDTRPPWGRLAGRSPAISGGHLESAAGQMFDKTKRKMIRPWFRQAAVPWKTTATQTRASGENRVSTKPGVLHAEDMVLVPRAELDALRAENRRLRREAGDREALRRIRSDAGDGRTFTREELAEAWGISE